MEKPDYKQYRNREKLRGGFLLRIIFAICVLAALIYCIYELLVLKTPAS
ncbi:MAG: hypothetical protein IBJ09_13190 [Bacteroidia bacterium]|nr:hypothetical protein [Bacteroidia bacterium]